MEILWPFILSGVAGLSTMLGCIFIFIPIKKREEFITFCLSFSLAVMLTVSIFDLIPSSLYGLKFGSIWTNIAIFIIFFAIGILITGIINYILEKEKGSSNLYKLGVLSFIALIMHNLPEGILTFMSTYKDFHLGVSLCFAIAMHNIPEGISIAVPIYYSTHSKWSAIKSTLYSALAEPLGALLAYVVLKDYIDDQMISIFLILVAGIMITLSIEKLLPEAISYKKAKPMYYGIILGIAIILISLFIL